MRLQSRYVKADWPWLLKYRSAELLDLDKYYRGIDRYSNILTCSAPLWVQVGNAVVSFFLHTALAAVEDFSPLHFFFPWETPAGFSKQVLLGMQQQLRKHVKCGTSSSFYSFGVTWIGSQWIFSKCRVYLKHPKWIYDMMNACLSLQGYRMCKTRWNNLTFSCIKTLMTNYFVKLLIPALPFKMDKMQLIEGFKLLKYLRVWISKASTI